MEKWRGRVALVTGASSGIGYLLAKALATEGVKVIGCARNIQKIKELSAHLAEAKSPGLVHAICCDLRNEDDITAMFSAIKEQFGGVDICINNAGLGYDEKFSCGETSKLREMLEVNLLAATICSKQSLASMRERGVDDGYIINMSSWLAHKPLRFFGFYSMTKMALHAYTEGLRYELKQQESHIRVSTVSPGLVKTEFIEHALGAATAQCLFEQMPSLDPSEVVNATLYLLSAPTHVETHDIIIHHTEQN